MKKNNLNKDKVYKSLDPLKPTFNSSLGHLAYGYSAFIAWRKLKKEKSQNEEK